MANFRFCDFMHHVWYCIEAGSTFVKPIHIERRDEAAFLLTKLLLLDWTLSFHTRSYSSFANLSKYSKPFLSTDDSEHPERLRDRWLSGWNSFSL